MFNPFPNSSRRAVILLATILWLLSIALPVPLSAQLQALVVASNGQNPIPADAAVAARLQTLGFQVTIVGALQSTTNDIEGKHLIVTLASVQSADLRGKFFNAPVPLINSEQAVLDNDYQMSSGGRGTSASQTQIDIVNPDHPLAAGLSGRVTVFDPAQGLTRGTPRPDTSIIVARSLDQPLQSCIFAYETGAEMYNLLVAPARRVHFMLSDASFVGLNAEGLRLFDAAVRWAADLPTVDAPPRLTDISPADGSVYQPVGVTVGFTATTHPSNTIPATPAGLQMFLNGVDVSAGLSVSGSAFNRVVTYTNALAVNTLYTVRVVVRDNASRESVRIWNFDTLSADSTLAIEAENFNFDFGQYINNPVISLDPLEPNSYFAKGAESGIAEIDFVELSPETRTPPEWRYAGGAGLPQTAESQDIVRQAYLDASVSEYDLVNILAGEWWNYTHDFTNANYRVYLRAKSAANQTVELHRVTADPTQPNQTTVLLGNFNTISGNGYSFIPLTEPNGAQMILHLSSAQTLRLMALNVTTNLNLNYVILVPTTNQAAVIGPYVQTFSPENGSPLARRDSISATIKDRDTAVNTNSIELLVDNVLVATGLTVTATSTGADVSYTVSPPFGPNSTHTVLLRYIDNMGNMFSYSWSFTTSPDALPVFTAPRLESGELKLLVAFAEPLDPSTAGELNNYSSSGGVAFNAVELFGNRAVQLTGTPVLDGPAYLLTVRNLEDTIGNVVPESTISYSIAPFLQDSNGLVVLESESYHTNTFGTGIYDGHVWRFAVDVAGYSGGGFMHNPAGFPLVAVSDVAFAARMDYRVRFGQPGTYKMWIRGTERPGTKDSCHYGVDGIHVAAVGGIAVGPFNWSAQPEDAPTTGTNRFNIPAAGDYTINTWVREDNFALDKVVIVLESANFDPASVNAGLGPDQSSRAVSNQPILQFSQPTASELTFNWTAAGFRLQQTTNIANPQWTEVVNGDTPPVTVTVTGQQMFFRLSN